MKIELNTTNARKVQEDLRASLPEGDFEATVVATDYGLLVLDEGGGLPIVAHAPDGTEYHFHYSLVEDLASEVSITGSERPIWESAARSKDRTKVFGLDA